MLSYLIEDFLRYRTIIRLGDAAGYASQGVAIASVVVCVGVARPVMARASVWRRGLGDMLDFARRNQTSPLSRALSGPMPCAPRDKFPVAGALGSDALRTP